MYKKEKEFVSIILSVYNDEGNVGKTIESVLNQSFTSFELLVIDDGSVDNSSEIIKDYAKIDKRIVLVHNKKNLGLTKSLNLGIKISNNRLIARIDAGDFWHSSKLEKQVNFLRDNNDYVIVGTNVKMFNQQTEEELMRFLPQTDKEIRKYLLHSSPMVHPSIMFRKEPAGYYNEKFIVGQDYELYSRILSKGKGYNLQEFLTFIRTHQNASISLRKWKEQKKARIKIRYQLFRQNKMPIFNYIKLIPDICLLLLPSNTKIIKNKTVALFKRNR